MTKFVDDSFFIIKNQIFDEIFQFLNSLDKRINFTYGKNSQSLNFLDLTLIRSEINSILFCHYKKPTYTGRIIHNLSNQPFHFKFNTACNVKDKWLGLSSKIFHSKILKELYTLFRQNGYSNRFIKSVFQHKTRTNIPNVNNVNISGNNRKKSSIFFSLPYTGQSSNILAKFLRDLHPDVQIAFRNHNSFKNIFFSRTKDTTPTTKNSELIYKIPWYWLFENVHR